VVKELDSIVESGSC